jgi:hypothetical protein
MKIHKENVKFERVSAREAQARNTERETQDYQGRNARFAGDQPRVFVVGDRIRITNGVRAGQEPTGTVTKVSPGRISITTDDGTHTWRARKNLIRWY